MDRLLLRPQEAAEILGVSRAKLYELLSDGTLPRVRLGGSVRVPALALRRWVDEKLETGSNAKPGVGEK